MPSLLNSIKKSLKTQIRFTASVKRKVLIGFILCLYLSFIVIVLEPFDTSQFEDEHKTALMAGYGFVACLVYIIHSRFENILYLKSGKVWAIKHEIITTFLFCFFVGSAAYLYNRLVVNLTDLSLSSYWRFLSKTTLYMMPVFVPLMLYLRQAFGEKIVPPAEGSFVLTGENKNEVLRLEKEDLLFIKAVENYVEICFIDKNKQVVSKTFRQTLSSVSDQVPFLEKCHRSYLVNISSIKEIDGNSQAAKITFGIGQKEIPLSKTYYKQIKNKVA